MQMQTGFGLSNNAKYLTVFFIKLTLVLGILTLFLYTVIFRIEPTGDEDEQEKEEQIVEPIPFQKAGPLDGHLHHPLRRRHETPALCKYTNMDILSMS